MSWAKKEGRGGEERKEKGVKEREKRAERSVQKPVKPYSAGVNI